MQTFNIENQAFFSIFSMENDLCPNNLQIIERIIQDKYVTYTWIAFSRKFDSIKLQTFKFENIRFKLSAQSEWSHCPCRDNGCHEQTIGSSTPFRKTGHLLIAPYEAVNEHSMPKKQSRPNFKDITHFRLVIATSTNRFQNGWCKSKRLGPGALFRAHWSPGLAFTYTCSPTVCRRKRYKLPFTNQRERFMEMEDAGRQLGETICRSSKKPTSKWLFARGVCTHLLNYHCCVNSART